MLAPAWDGRYASAPAGDERYARYASELAEFGMCALLYAEVYEACLVDGLRRQVPSRPLGLTICTAGRADTGLPFSSRTMSLWPW